MPIKFSIGLLLLFLVAVSACTKDIQPSPVGEPVPYKPTATRKWQDIMNDADLSLFSAAWKRSDMQEWTAKTGSAYLTFFMPTNEAFTNAGWTSDKIAAASAESLDTLLAYYVTAGSYAPLNIKSAIGRSLPLSTLLRREVDGISQPYVFRQYIGSWNDSLMMNGEPVSKWTESEEALNGYVYKIRHFSRRPTMTIYDYLSSDPRFSSLLQAINISNEYYVDDALYNNPSYLEMLSGTLNGYSLGARITLFAPTNAAFTASGLGDEAAIRQRIEASLPIGYPDYDENFFYQYPITSMDSILRPHGFSLARMGYDRDVVFFSRDLLQEPALFSGYLALAGAKYNNAPVSMETAFENRQGQLFIRDFLSDGLREPVTEKDILCYNGVIHVVEQGLLRK